MQFDNSGDYVHSAPWSVDDQGKRDVSHGCINISPTNAKWFFDQLRHRRSHRREELRRDLQQERRLQRLAA